MKTRLILILGIVCLLFTRMYGQFIVYQDEKGQVLTTADSYATGKQYATTASYTKATCLESPFLTYPVWQDGTIQLDRSGRKISCQLAYNLVSNEVLCRFDGDSTVKIVTPEFFTINGTEFVRLQNNVAGLDYRRYFSMLHNGPTKLWMSLSSRLEPLNGAEVIKNRDHRDLTIQAVYRTNPKYYIQKGNRELIPVSLTKKSLLAIFSNLPEMLAAKIPTKPLTTNDVIDAINSYDSLEATAKSDLNHLSGNEAFKFLLTHQIAYPVRAGFQGLYGRIYAGFDVDSLGKIRNIMMLSPENIGFGFTDAVRKTLETLPDISPQLSGHYALPVAFTYTNSNENAGSHVPVNRLPDNRMENRTLLDEVIVPFVVSKSVITSREVWGYYK